MKLYFFIITSLLVSLSAVAEPVEVIQVTSPANSSYQVQQFSSKEFPESFRIQETSPGMLSPYLGAFTGNQVDQIVNGVRMSNSYFRSGPNQYFGWVPLEFTSNIKVSDGGNIGGSIDRLISVVESSASLQTDSALNSTNYTVMSSGELLSVAYNKVNTSNVETSSGTIPNSSYNRESILVDKQFNTLGNTTILHTKSENLPRTDKYNGGLRLSGFREGSVYKYQLQEYSLISHTFELDKLSSTIGFQNFKESILDKQTVTDVEIDVYSIDASYSLYKDTALYGSKYFENITYNNQKDSYDTLKVGLRGKKNYSGVSFAGSLGLKEVNVTGFNTFKSNELSLVVSSKGYFLSYDESSRAPDYSTLLKTKTTGRGIVIPNPALVSENAKTIRVGKQTNNFYIDLYYKKLDDPYGQITVSTDTYQTVNEDSAVAYGSSLKYENANIFDSGFSLYSRVEFTRAYFSETKEPFSKVAPLVSFIKLSKDFYYIEHSYQPKDKDQSFKDLDDVRIYSFNKGYSVTSVGAIKKYKDFTIDIKAYNLFKNTGRVLGSSVDVKDRSIQLSVKYFL